MDVGDEVEIEIVNEIEDEIEDEGANGERVDAGEDGVGVVGHPSPPPSPEGV